MSLVGTSQTFPSRLSVSRRKHSSLKSQCFAIMWRGWKWCCNSDQITHACQRCKVPWAPCDMQSFIWGSERACLSVSRTSCLLQILHFQNAQIRVYPAIQVWFVAKNPSCHPEFAKSDSNACVHLRQMQPPWFQLCCIVCIDWPGWLLWGLSQVLMQVAEKQTVWCSWLLWSWGNMWLWTRVLKLVHSLFQEVHCNFEWLLTCDRKLGTRLFYPTLCGSFRIICKCQRYHNSPNKVS